MSTPLSLPAVLRFMLAVLAASVTWAGTAQAEAGWPDLSVPAIGKGGGQNDAALIVGIEKYAFAPAVPGAVRNAKDWGRYFAETRGLPFGSFKVLLDEHATAEEIRQSAQDVAARVKPGGTLWFVFIGHGAPTKDGSDGLLVGADAQQTETSLYARSVPQRELAHMLGKGAQARSVVLVDACFSGLRPDGEPLLDVQPLVSVRIAPLANAVMLLAAQSNQYAGALPGAKRPAFSYLILGGLRGWADENGDGIVTASEVVKLAQVALWTLVKDRTQTPELIGDGETVLAENASEAKPDLTTLARSLDDAGPVAVKQLAEPATLGPSPPPVATTNIILPLAPTPAKDTRAGFWRTAGLATMVGGGAIVGVGAYFGLHARSLADDLSSGKIYDSAKDDERKSSVTKQYLCYGAGGAILAGGLVMALFGDNHSDLTMVPALGPQYAGFSLTARTH